MSTSLRTRAAANGLAAVQRLKGIWFTLAQTSVASGLAWYLAHDVLAHPQPFFAPIAAAVRVSWSRTRSKSRAPTSTRQTPGGSPSRAARSPMTVPSR